MSLGCCWRLRMRLRRGCRGRSLRDWGTETAIRNSRVIARMYHLSGFAV